MGLECTCHNPQSNKCAETTMSLVDKARGEGTGVCATNRSSTSTTTNNSDARQLLLRTLCRHRRRGRGCNIHWPLQDVELAAVLELFGRKNGTLVLARLAVERKPDVDGGGGQHNSPHQPCHCQLGFVHGDGRSGVSTHDWPALQRVTTWQHAPENAQCLRLKNIAPSLRDAFIMIHVSHDVWSTTVRTIPPNTHTHVPPTHTRGRSCHGHHHAGPRRGHVGPATPRHVRR